jgi:predicted acyl esterase
LNFSQIEHQNKKAEEFNDLYFTSAPIIEDSKVINPVVLKLMVNQQRNKVDSTWKPEQLQMDRKLKAIIESSK